MQGNIIAVITSVGERTENLCYTELSKIIPKVEIVRNVAPYHKALETMYNIGIDSRAEWMVYLAADMIPVNSAFEDFANKIDTKDDKLFAYKSRYFCKYKQGIFHSAPIWYKVELLPMILDMFSEKYKDLKCPEGQLHRKLQINGYKREAIRKATSRYHAVHGFYQYYADLYIAGSRKKIKTDDATMKKLASMWLQKSKSDADYLALYLGYKDANTTNEFHHLDITKYDKDKIRDILASNGLTEKAPLDYRGIKV